MWSFSGFSDDFQLFLSEGGLNVLVLDLAKDPNGSLATEVPDIVLRWVRSIRLCAPASEILVVDTHVDEKAYRSLGLFFFASR